MDICQLYKYIYEYIALTSCIDTYLSILMYSLVNIKENSGQNVN